MKLAIVTATLDMERSRECRRSWMRCATGPVAVYTVVQASPSALVGWNQTWVIDAPLWWYDTPEILGVVPAFAIGVQKALEEGAEVVACLHDDLLITQAGWDQMVADLLMKEPQIGLLGFGGGTGLADDNIYQVPYNPMQLVRKDFCSNLRDAEAHGRRETRAIRVACLDGFSQIGRAAFWAGDRRGTDEDEATAPEYNLFAVMQAWGIVHHAYDAALGAFAKRLGWEAWMLPIACHHFGGQTAVADTRYHAWANTHQSTVLDFGERHVTDLRGDQLFWEQAHRIVYDQFRDVLPIRL